MWKPNAGEMARKPQKLNLIVSMFTSYNLKEETTPDLQATT